MALHGERVTLVLNDNFSERMARVRDAVHRLAVRDELRRATWEPIDWSDFQ